MNLNALWLVGLNDVTFQVTSSKHLRILVIFIHKHTHACSLNHEVVQARKKSGVKIHLFDT